MSFRSISLACLLSLAGCGPKAPEIVHVGDANFRFPRDPFYRSITDEGASKPSFVAYVTPEKDRRRSISLEYDSSENIKDRTDAERQGLPYIFRGSFQFRYAHDAFIVRRPWGTSICLRKAIKVGLLRNCAANVTYRGARWVVYFQHDMLDDPENVTARGLSVLRAYTIDA
jgi:hypothetical protein